MGRFDLTDDEGSVIASPLPNTPRGVPHVDAAITVVVIPIHA